MQRCCELAIQYNSSTHLPCKECTIKRCGKIGKLDKKGTGNISAILSIDIRTMWDAVEYLVNIFALCTHGLGMIEGSVISFFWANPERIPNISRTLYFGTNDFFLVRLSKTDSLPLREVSERLWVNGELLFIVYPWQSFAGSSQTSRTERTSSCRGRICSDMSTWNRPRRS